MNATRPLAGRSRCETVLLVPFLESWNHVDCHVQRETDRRVRDHRLIGVLVSLAIAQAASGTPKGKLAKVERQLAKLQTETGKFSRLLDSDDQDLPHESQRAVVDSLAVAVGALNHVQSDLRTVRAPINRPRNDHPVVEADVQDMQVGSGDQPASWTFNSTQHGNGDVSVWQKICIGGSEQIAVLHATTLNPGREGVPFPGRYEISIDCAGPHHKVPSLIVQPRDRDIIDEQTGRWLENPWDWVVFDQSGVDPSGVIVPRPWGLQLVGHAALSRRSARASRCEPPPQRSRGRFA